MKISHSSISFATQYNQQKIRQIEQQGSVTSGSEENSLSQQRLALNSNQWQSVSTYSSMGDLQHTSSLQKQSQFSRFYTKEIAVGGDSVLVQSQSIVSNKNQYFSYQDNQSMNVVIRGSVTTLNGDTVDFEFRATASQSFSFEYASGEYAERISERKDPLIINYGGGFNNLSGEAYQFDLDGDGKAETISFAGSGSGFLAFDKNGDGIINDGSELFGAKTGNGFVELAQYDEDGNGYIDSGDSVFKQLRIYEKTSDGEDKLTSLADLEIAAIGLESTVTPFRIADSLNNELGMARATGVFIRSNGSVGSVQQIDLTLRNSVEEKKLASAFSAPSDVLPEDGENSDPELENLMAQIQQAKQQRLDRQEKLVNNDEGEEAKTLLEQLVDKLEEYISKQRDVEEDK